MFIQLQLLFTFEVVSNLILYNALQDVNNESVQVSLRKFRAYLILFGAGFGLDIICHWIFSMKYWVISLKLEQMLTNKPFSSVCVQFTFVIFIVFVTVQVLFGFYLFYWNPTQFKYYQLVSFLDSLPALLSALILTDAFRRLKNLRL